METRGKASFARRRLRFIPVLLVAIGLAAVVAACGGSGDDGGGEAAATTAAPAATTAAETGAAETTAAETSASGECAVDGVDDGVINIFATADTPSAIIGQNIGPAGYDGMGKLWVEQVNAAGGIDGCTVQFDVKDDSFDIPTCLRLYRDAIASDQYDFFIGPVNSGCMASLPDLTNAAGKWLISGVAADHQPFFDPKFPKAPFVSHPSVSTFLEGRAIAVFAQQMGWKRVALMVPNYAYGQDLGKAFSEYYKQLVPDGEIVDEQFPEFDEDNFTPFINAMTSKNPDGIVTAFFSSFILPFAKQWQASGFDQEIPVVSGLSVFDTMAGLKSESEIPANFYGYDRGNWQLLSQTPVGKEYYDLWLEKEASTWPLPDSFPYQILSSFQMAKGLIEATKSVDPEKWNTAIEAGDFSFDSPYQDGPTYVNPINHMGDTCAEVGKIVWDSANNRATLDVNSFVVTCMDQVLPADEATQITSNPHNVSEEAIQNYYSAVGGG